MTAGGGGGTGRVSVVTRTMGRPAFLRRVGAALGAAAPAGLEWIVVDDSGEPGTGRDEASAAAARWNLNLVLVASGQRHRARALNSGLAAATGDFLHILDDDDTIMRGFYDAALARLAEQPRFGAVACRAERVDEKVSAGGDLQELRRRPHYPELRAVSLMSMAVQQVTPPCSLLFRREAMDATGAFDPGLEVCEDHEYLLRFMLRHDIGLIDRTLCAFHVRSKDAPEGWRNSRATLAHAEADALFRNAMLRRSLDDPADRIGLLLAAGELLRGVDKLDRGLTLISRLPLAGWLRGRGE
jgi:glycosyltransferase involved in cell wall biosynthesis